MAIGIKIFKANALKLHIESPLLLLSCTQFHTRILSRHFTKSLQGLIKESLVMEAVMIQLSDVRTEIENMTLTGNLCDTTWTKWKEAAGIRKYARKCSKEQWVSLCAVLALHRSNRPINPVAVRVFLCTNGNDPLAFLPGMVPLAGKTLPGTCDGDKLPEVIEEWTGFKPTEWTVRRWVQAIGLEYSRCLTYCTEDIKKIIGVYLKNRQRKIQHGKTLGMTRHLNRKAA